MLDGEPQHEPDIEALRRKWQQAQVPYGLSREFGLSEPMLGPLLGFPERVTDRLMRSGRGRLHLWQKTTEAVQAAESRLGPVPSRTIAIKAKGIAGALAQAPAIRRIVLAEDRKRLYGQIGEAAYSWLIERGADLELDCTQHAGTYCFNTAERIGAACFSAWLEDQDPWVRRYLAPIKDDDDSIAADSGIANAAHLFEKAYHYVRS